MKSFLKVFYLLPVAVVLAVVLYLEWNHAKPPPVRVMSGRPFISAPITNLTANFFTSEGHLGPAANDVFMGDWQGKLFIGAPTNQVEADFPVTVK